MTCLTQNFAGICEIATGGSSYNLDQLKSGHGVSPEKKTGDEALKLSHLVRAIIHAAIAIILFGLALFLFIDVGPGLCVAIMLVALILGIVFRVIPTGPFDYW